MPDSSSPQDDAWSDRQLAARLLLDGPPPPLHHIVYRATLFADGHETTAYDLPGVPGAADEAGLRTWMARQAVTGDTRLGIAVLVIREVLDAAGLIRECVLEHHRGSAAGPLLSRTEFAGPARHVRAYQALRNGRLAEIAAVPVPSRASMEPIGAEDAALQNRLGSGIVVLDRRAPTLFESMAGLSGIAQVRLPDGRETGVGIGWFGTRPFVLAADFPRFEPRLDLTPDQDAAVAAILADRDLVRHELRLDAQGLGVVARQRGGNALFIIRPRDHAAIVEPFHPTRDTPVGEDQQRSLRYLESYEGQKILDVFRFGATNEIVALTADAEARIWRRQIDADGVELARAPDPDSAIATLYREQVPRDAGATRPADPSPPPLVVAAALREPPPDSLLGTTRAVSDALAALRDTRSACVAADDPAGAVPAAALRHLRVVPPLLHRLAVRLAAALCRDLLRRAELGTIDVADFDAAIGEVETRVMEELGVLRVATIAPPWPSLREFGPLHDAVRTHFPSAAWHIEEAIRCLALGRPTAAVLHAMRVVQTTLAAGVPNWGRADQFGTWQQVIQSLRSSVAPAAALIELVDGLAQCWQSPDLIPADKYTEAEAAAVLEALWIFLPALVAAAEGI